MFILFEGPDNCGKTTQADLLFKKYLKLNKKVKRISFPDRRTEIGKVLHNHLNSKIKIHSKEAIHLLFSANRWEKKNEIEELLNSGYFIICDRYIPSGYVYSMVNGLDSIWCKHADQGLPIPDITFLFENNINVDGNELYENETFQSKVCNEFKKIKGNNIYRINSHKSIHEISNIVYDTLTKLPIVTTSDTN